LINITPERNYVLPTDFENMNQYGVIYIATHGSPDTLECGPVFYNIEKTKDWQDWITTNKEYSRTEPNTWAEGNWFYTYRKVLTPEWTRCLTLRANYFTNHNTSLGNSIVYIDACNSDLLRLNLNSPFHTSRVYLGHDRPNYGMWSRQVAYKFFCYMIFGTGVVPSQNQDNPTLPLSVQEAYTELTYKDVNPIFNMNPDPTDYGPVNPNLPYRPDIRLNAHEYQGCQLA